MTNISNNRLACIGAGIAALAAVLMGQRDLAEMIYPAIYGAILAVAIFGK